MRAAVVASIVLPLLLLIVGGALSYRSHDREAEERLRRLLDVVGEHAARVFDSHELVADFVDEILFGKSPEEIRLNEAALHTRVRQLADSLAQVQDIWVLDEKGRALVTGNVFPAPSHLDLSDRDYWRVFRDGRTSTYVSELLVGRADRSVQFFQMARARRTYDRTFQGVVAVSVQPEYFSDFYRSLSEGSTLTIALARTDGAMLAAYPGPLKPGIRMAQTEGFGTTIPPEGDSGVLFRRSALDNVNRRIIFRRLPRHDVQVVVAEPMRVVLYNWMGSMAAHLGFGIPATAGLFLISLLALRRTQRESLALQQLREEVARREETEGQLRQSQKMEAVGRLTGGVAHDFNNLLTVIRGNLETLRRYVAEDNARGQRALDNAVLGADRAAALTHRLLAFSRQQPLDTRLVDLNEVVEGMWSLVTRATGERVRCIRKLTNEHAPVLTDPNQLENALLNLSINARDAMPAGGMLTISTRHMSWQGADEELVPGDYIVLGVSDTGVGMSEETIARVFEPFFTTKPLGEGTGLGLSMVYGFMRQSGGAARIESQPGKGTTVSLYFPRAPADAIKEAKPRIANEPAAAGRPGARILLVEDDAGVRAWCSEVLREAGYKVVEAADADEALQLMETIDEDIDLLFSDVVLPGGRNGRELAEEAQRREPSLKALLTTGYTSDPVVTSAVASAALDLLPKPFTAEELLSRIARLLPQV